MRSPARLPLDALTPFLFEVPHPFRPSGEPRGVSPRGFWTGSKPLRWPELFGNGDPVEIEVGFGKGLFLLNASSAQPGTNFLGIEKERKYTLLTATRLVKSQRRNVRVICSDGRWFLGEWVADRSVQAVHTYFPDPWWKKRHHKRRLFTEEFAREVVRVLRIGGLLNLATDVAEYFEDTKEMLGGLTDLVMLSAPEEKRPEHDMDYLTNFERKFRKQGKPIYRGLWKRNQ